MIEQDVNTPVSIPWEVSCKIACLAMINRCTFNEMVIKMMAAR